MYLTSDEEDFVVAKSTKLHKITVNSKNIQTVDISENVDTTQLKNPLALQINGVALKDKYIAVCTNTKNLLLYDSDLKILDKWLTNRSPSQLCFVNVSTIILADKTGDVYMYKRNEPKPTLLLGHLSMILDVKMTLCGKYILTADRDEKIRVSCFPNAYNIKSFCLGHEEFVTSIRILDVNRILTVSGDGTIRFWNFIDGQEVYQINCNNFISDSKKIELFSSEMRVANVKINSLPITHVSVRIVNESEIHVAVSLHDVDDLLIFKVEMTNFESEKLQTLSIPNITSLYFYKDRLYVFTKNIVNSFAVDGSNGCYSETSCDLVNLIRANVDLSDNIDEDRNDAVVLLFKKSFDNLQEYQERKKLRIDDKSS